MSAEVTGPHFRAGFSQLAGAVCIVATGSSHRPAGRHGLTATSVCSLTDDPPSLVACLNRETGTYQHLLEQKAFSVNVLSVRQVELAHVFAGRTSLCGAERFQVGCWAAGTLDVPLLTGALAHFECRVSKMFEFGTHAMVVGRIETLRWSEEDVDPLVYHRHQFHDIGAEVEVQEVPPA